MYTAYKKKGVSLTIKKTIDPNFVNKSVVFFFVTLFIIRSVSVLNIHSQDEIFSPLRISKNIAWNVTLTFTEIDDKNDYVVFGEADNASDGLDS